MYSERAGGSGALRMEIISDGNYRIWKQKDELVLDYCKADVAIVEENQFQQDSPKYTRWNQCDETACAIVGLSISEDKLEHVRECSSAREMLQNIKDTFQMHTLLNKI